MAAIEQEDWRIVTTGRLAHDLPAAFPGGPSHKAGASVRLATLVETKQGELVSFELPSATALAFSIALRASHEAKELRSSFSFRQIPSPKGPAKSVAPESAPQLFDFLEKCMIAASFSFQALEVFCNHVISRELKEPFRLKRGKRWDTLRPIEIERHISTRMKLSHVLPIIREVENPTETKLWSRYDALEHARNSTIHLKSADQDAIDADTLYHKFLHGNPVDYPKTASDIITYFTPKMRPTWLLLLQKKLEQYEETPR